MGIRQEGEQSAGETSDPSFRTKQTIQLSRLGIDRPELNENGLNIITIKDELQGLRDRCTTPEGQQILSQVRSVTAIEFDPDHGSGILRRTAVFMEDDEGNMASISITFNGEAPGVQVGEDEDYVPVVHGPAYFGGAGIYSSDPLDVIEGVEHSEKLAQAMTEKGWVCGVEDVLRGSKTIISGSDWSGSEKLQQVTGYIFSKNGLFGNVITGSDAGQTPQSIENMAYGSRAGEGLGQIVGSEQGLPDTPSYVSHSMRAAYETLRDIHPHVKDPEDITVAVQGFGNIGFHTARAFAEAGTRDFVVSDILLFNESTPQDLPIEAVSFYRDRINQRIEVLQEMGVDVRVVKPDEIWDVSEDVFCPCSSQEGIIDEDKIDRLKRSGTSVVLSGANSPLSSDQVAEHAHNEGILIPSDTVANCGSATSAALEARYLVRQDEFASPADFEQQVLAPHIRKNVSEKIKDAHEFSTQKDVSLWTANKELFHQWLQEQSDI